MAGAYCKFCDHRCFVNRRMPADARWMPGQTVHMATCPRGKAYDLEQTGYDADTAINPAAAEKPGHPFGAIFAGTVDTRRPKTDGGPSVTEFLRSKGEL